jgi:hypothetical protein
MIWLPGPALPPATIRVAANAIRAVPQRQSAHRLRPQSGSLAAARTKGTFLKARYHRLAARLGKKQASFAFDVAASSLVGEG